MAHRFIVGESPKAALKVLRELWDGGAATSVDLLGEATVTSEEADRYAARCLEALEMLAAAVPRWPARPALEADSLGPLPRVNLSVKVSALTPLMRPEAPEKGRDDAAARMRPAAAPARRSSTPTCTSTWSRSTRSRRRMELVHELLDEPEFRDGPVVRAWCSRPTCASRREQLDRLIEWARASSRRPPLTVRLVKGAYWDHEVVEARQHGWAPPVFEVKADSDRNFEELTRRLLDARPLFRVAIASHNLRSVAHAIAWNRSTGGEDRDLELQILRGLGDELQQALAAARATACARTARWATWWRAWPTWCGGCSRTPRTTRSWASSSAGMPIEELLAAP